MFLSDSFAQVVSLYEFYLNVILLTMAVSLQNVYLFVLLLCLFTKHIPEQLLKHLSEHLNLSLGKRPSGAKNCNSMNAGGLTTSSGFISGHVFNLTAFIFYLVYDADNQFSTKRMTLVSLLLVFDALVACARVSLGCHTKFQVAFGFVGGIVWGYVIYKIMRYIESKSSRVTTDHQTLHSLLK